MINIYGTFNKLNNKTEKPNKNFPRLQQNTVQFLVVHNSLLHKLIKSPYPYPVSVVSDGYAFIMLAQSYNNIFIETARATLSTSIW